MRSKLLICGILAVAFVGIFLITGNMVSGAVFAVCGAAKAFVG